MKNLLRGLHALERLPRYRSPPDWLQQRNIRALRSLSQQDFERLLASAQEQGAEQPREFLEREAAACVAWDNALEAEVRRKGFKSLAESERTGGQRR